VAADTRSSTIRKSTDEDTGARIRGADIMRRFEDALRSHSEPPHSIPRVCAELRVSEQTLPPYCRIQLGMGPRRYLRLRQLQTARRALRSAEPDSIRISGIALRYGFGAPGRFAASYREQLGELPSDTMRRRFSSASGGAGPARAAVFR
jgi:AraC family transcriptional regulator, ethanolamine operon transcriptional activator